MAMMTIDELIAELRKLPEGSEVVGTSGWSQPPPEIVPSTHVRLARGFEIQIRLPDKVRSVGRGGKVQ